MLSTLKSLIAFKGFIRLFDILVPIYGLLVSSILHSLLFFSSQCMTVFLDNI